MDYIDKPQYWGKFIQTFKDQYDLGLMKQMEMMDEIVGGEQYFWEENDKFITVPVAAGAPVNNTTYATITYDAASHTDSGKKSYGRVGETIELPNYLSGLITAKNTSVDGAHTIDVKPIGTDSSGAAITVAALVANITAGMPLPIITNGWTEGGAGLGSTIMSSVSKFSNRIQNITETYEVTFNSQTNETWVDFPFNAPDGTAKNRYWVKQAHEAEIRMMRAIMLASFNGKGGSTTDASGNTVYFTEGLYTTSEKYATLLPYGSTISKAYYDQLEKITRNNFSGNEYTQFVGLTANQKLQDLKVDYKKNRPDGVSPELINTRVNRMEIGDNTYDIVPLKVLSDPYSLGVIGTKYQSTILTLPSGASTVMVDNKPVESKYFMMRYKPRVRPYKGKSYFAVETLGYNGSVATNANDVKTYAWKASIGAQTHSARNFVLSYAS
jgi:hypothetical protein